MTKVTSVRRQDINLAIVLVFLMPLLVEFILATAIFLAVTGLTIAFIFRIINKANMRFNAACACGDNK